MPHIANKFMRSNPRNADNSFCRLHEKPLRPADFVFFVQKFAELARILLHGARRRQSRPPHHLLQFHVPNREGVQNQTNVQTFPKEEEVMLNAFE